MLPLSGRIVERDEARSTHINAAEVEPRRQSHERDNWDSRTQPND
jgi:hypothetical protein